MWFFKKKENQEKIPLWKQELYEKAKEKMKLNYFSPSQIEKVIRENEDIDFLDDEIRKEMNYPDILFLMGKLMPEKIQENRKEIENIDVMKGAILGDIIGSVYEFTEHDYEQAKIEELPPEYAKFTDDTVLSIATMNAILENETNPDFRKWYIDMYKKYPMAGYGSAFVGWALNETVSPNGIDNTKGYHSMGNGCAMRVSFIGAYYKDINDVIKHTISATMTTHDHIESIKGTVVTAVCIWMAINNYTKEEIYEYCKKHYDVEESKRNELAYAWSYYDLNQEISSLSNELSKKSLYVNYAVPYAIKCFFETNSCEECMREILSHFGDTDTICAIAGGLCYAYYENTEFEMEKILKEKHIDLKNF